MLRSVPLIVILGSTGTGKTKLSVELARRFGGEIISADSMQVYRGLDIATAKASAAERAAAPHHLLDVALPGRPYTVVDFRDAALPIVDGLLADGRVPIVVGGTNYYIESLLWRVLVSPPQTAGDKRRLLPEIDDDSSSTAKRAYIEPADDAEQSPSADPVAALTDADLAAMPAVDLHRLLKSVDRPQADRLHPNNRRKTIRALQVYRDCGRPLSAVLEAQQATPGGSSLGGPLRYEHCILFWLRCDQAVLERRLDERIDQMVGSGLLAEIRDFHDGLGGATKTGYTQGILQTIGFKEFVPYLEQFDRAEDERITEWTRREPAATTTTADGDAEPAGWATLQRCLDELRLVTKRYAKKQLKWVSNRFLTAGERRVPPVYELDSSCVSDWPATVFARAERIVDAYVQDTQAADCAPMEPLESRRGGLREDVTNVCTACDRTFIGEFQWRIHLRSNKHKRTVERKRRADETAACGVVGSETAAE